MKNGSIYKMVELSTSQIDELELFESNLRKYPDRWERYINEVKDIVTGNYSTNRYANQKAQLILAIHKKLKPHG